MDYVKLFIVDGLFGYVLQSMGCVVAIAAFNRKPFSKKDFFLCLLLFSLVSFGIRQIEAISFGFHTILIMMIFSVIAIFIFKTSSYPTVLALLLTSVLIILAETINFGLLSLIFGSDVINTILKGGNTVSGKISKSLIGIPTNIIMLGIVLAVYRFRMKGTKKEAHNGEAGK